MKKDRTAFRQGFLACYRYFWLERPHPNDARQIAYKAHDWKQSYAQGWLACADASEEHATHGVMELLERGLLTAEKQKKLIHWAENWEVR